MAGSNIRFNFDTLMGHADHCAGGVRYQHGCAYCDMGNGAAKRMWDVDDPRVQSDAKFYDAAKKSGKRQVRYGDENEVSGQTSPERSARSPRSKAVARGCGQG